MKEISNKKKGIRLIAARLAVLLMTLGMLLSSMPFELLSYANETDNAQPAAEQSSDAGAQTQEKPKADSAQTETPKEEPKAEPDDGVLEVSSEAGSYTVDFYYTPEDGKPTEFHLKGGSEIMMSELFKKLGIERDAASIKETVFTDNELVKFIREGDDYRIVSLKPFNTEESLTITFEDGEIIVLRVEDRIVSQGGIGNGNLYYEIDDSPGGGNVKLIFRANSAGGGEGGTAELKNKQIDGASSWNYHSYRNKIVEVEFRADITVANGQSAAYMFSDMTNLKKITFNTEKNGRFDTKGASSLQSMFQNCSSLEEIILPDFNNEGRVSYMQDMFAGCTKLQKIVLGSEGSSFETRPATGRDSGGCQMQRMFNNCSSLKHLEFMNCSFDCGRTTWGNITDAFRSAGYKNSLETLIFKDCTFPGAVNPSNSFQNCSNLTTVDMSSCRFPDAEKMENMFANSFTNPTGEGTPTLDVSGFGKLEDIVNMNGFVNGCTGLKVLNIDKLDNSVIGPTNWMHSVSDADSQITGASEYGRMLDIHTCTALETLSAKESVVWMVYNNRGVPGSEYFKASDDDHKDIYYFTDKAMTFDADAGAKGVVIDSDRDYIDLIIDRDGSSNKHTTDPAKDPLPDAATNINIKNGDLNTNGPGFLAPGVYTLSGSRSDPAHAPMEDTYYRIAYVGDSPYTVEWPDGGIEGLVKVEDSSHNYVTINTKMMDWPTSGSKVIDCGDGIKIVYKDVAIDANGKLHDVEVTIKKITFKDLDKVPHLTDSLGGVPYSDRTHDYNVDNNKVLAEDQQYYRPVLQAKKDGITLLNYIRAGDGADPDNPGSGIQMLTGGSGTDIDFSIEILDANPGTSFVFLAEDLDVPYAQNWQYNSNGDACYDKLTVDSETYGNGGEGFVLGEGVRTDTVQFAKETGLYKSENKVLASGGDPHTPWSEFTVTGDATGASFTWTSGVGCTSYILHNTKEQEVGQITIQPQVRKQLINGTLSAGDYDFKLEKVSTTPNGVPEPSNGTSTPSAVPQTKSNDASGNVTFDKLVYKTEGYNPEISGSNNFNYFPGTDPDNNTEGQGKHNTISYKYKITEVMPSNHDPATIYDTTPQTLEIKIYTPENDEEMKKGIKAEIYANDTLVDTYWHSTGYSTVSTGTLGEKWYDKNGSEIADPNPIDLSRILFKNKVVKPIDVRLPVEKILSGRPWKETDKFAAGLVLESSGAPMPANTETIGDGHKMSEVVIDSTDTPVKNEDNKIIGYKDAFGSITYTMDDVNKTYEYTVRELTPAESSVGPIPGVTYDTESYTVKVKITLDTSDPDNPKLVATPTYTGKDGTVTIPSFTNVYDAQETDYKMEAVKDFYDITKGEEIELKGDEFEFAVKPIGENAAIAPMPAGYEGSGADRRYYKTNESDGDIEFEGHPDQIKDGMVFNYKALLEAGVDDAALHSVKGVDFEYEIYEIIPGSPEGIARGKTLTSKETLVNNEDGTYSVIGDDYEIVYDGVHHTRKITVKVIAGDATQTGDKVTVGGVDYEVYKDFKGVEFYNKDGKSYKKSDNTLYAPDLETLDVEGHEDDHKSCYYISEKGGEAVEVPMSEVDGYDPSRHHFKVDEEGVEVKGAPIFINYRFDQKYVDLKVIKKWDDGNDSDKIRPNSITATITSDEGDYKPKDLVLKKNSWKASEKLPVWKFDIETESLKKINYSVKEAKVPEGYTVSYSPNPSSITLDPKKDEFALTITNSHTPETKPDDGDDDCPDCDNDGDKDKEGINGDSGRGKAAGVHTGDEARAIVWMTLLAAAFATMIAVIIRRRRREQ